ncbi:MAG: hypothetical protein H3C49_08500 [Alphaproteobacteria bacterium]|nr:hypothetical protein [Alphaproteobacteria bacterium]
MATSKRAPAHELTNAFANAANHEVKYREGRTREQLAAARRAEAAQKESERISAAKSKQDAAYEKKILKIFQDAKKIYDKAFGDTGNIAVRIEGNKIKIEEVGTSYHQARQFNPASTPFEPSWLHGAYGKIITVKNGALSSRSWGSRIDPQYRNYPLSLTEERLREALISPARIVGDKASLERMAALSVPAQKKKPQNASRPRR